ncbi:MAG: YidC/Oxa1 family insertase periplasmic-domain containing protein [Thermoguttaceae bacterium]
MDEQRPNDRMLERTLLFVTLSIGILWFQSYLMSRNRPQAQKPVEQAEDLKPKEEPVQAQKDGASVGPAAGPDQRPEAEEQPQLPTRYATLGSADPASPYRMLVTLTTRGAAVVRAELNSPKYPSVDDRTGYLGHIVGNSGAAEDECVVQAVGPGTPAEKAGIQPGDLVLSVDGEPITDPDSLTRTLLLARPDQVVSIVVKRAGKPLTLQAQLGRRPMEVIRPELAQPHNGNAPEAYDPLSFLLTLHQVDDARLPDLNPDKFQEIRKEKSREDVPSDPAVNAELEGVALREANWELVSSSPKEAVFRGKSQGFEFTKTYRLAETPPEAAGDADFPAYHLELVISVRNLAEAAHEIAYQLDGPTGLPIEGSWHANKVGPGWGLYGLRDVLISLNEKTPVVHRTTDIAADTLGTLILAESDHLTYVGVDSQYFSSILIPQRKPEDPRWFSRCHPIRVGQYAKKNVKVTDTSCRIVSIPAELQPGAEIRHTFHVFIGPKRPPLLGQYGLQDTVSYGWFWYVAIPMQWVLHFFERYIVFNYGLAIILLTVVVRLCMFPISRKQALGAQKMQELQPELKAISEKYKKDPEALRHAQQELFRKHNYNPLSGCLPVFFQLPIFIGLYRALMVDVELRGASLLGHGVRWCSNLAAPDMLFYWGSFWDRIGWDWFNTGQSMFALGPYFNILPLVTIALFIVQQKMFMPPPNDDQARMQQNMMTFMMVFMGLLFFKVASGLCIYFIASSLWGVAEKKLLPKKAGDPTPGSPGLSTISPWRKRSPKPGKPPADRKGKR